MFTSPNVQLLELSDGLVELRFDRKDATFNKLDAATMADFQRAISLLVSRPSLRGVLVSSAKDGFIVGADITEFGELFTLTPQEISEDVWRKNQSFIAFEDLAVPSVVAINGIALGGGLELALCGSLRVIARHAQVGIPEVNLGLFPGLGGTVRLARLAGPQVATEWVISGKPASAQSALAARVVDAVADPESLRDQALILLRQAAAGEIDWRARQQIKRSPVELDAAALFDVFTSAREKTARQTDRHLPAARAAIDMMEAACTVPRESAIRMEAQAFGHLARSQATASLVQAFLNEQALKKLFKHQMKQARPVKHGAVLGAGIMGGGIAYSSALRGIPIRLKDITQAQLDLGMQEARKQLDKLVKTGKKSSAQADEIFKSIHPGLDYAHFTQPDVVIEAVVENLKVKHQVLRALEEVTHVDAVIASNTSSLRIDELAVGLQRPENFVGMHFFNPVPAMRLVEVIKGRLSSDAAVATAIGYCVAMGKTPIVVKDCPGFLINRILTTYLRGFLQLINDGADFVQIDRVMEAFGWPMGPAYLSDVVGMDTGSHVNDVISAGYPARMPRMANDALRLMAGHKRFGQKNGVGFYQYDTAPNAKPMRSPAQDSHALLAALQLSGTKSFSDEEIIDRLMIPLINEAAHALEEGIVNTPAELDTALLLGVGFPAYLGGALKYADWLGLGVVVAKADRLAHLDPTYQATPRMREMAASGATYY